MEMHVVDDDAIYDRRPGEPQAAYHAFQHYLQQPAPERSRDRAYRSHQTGCRKRAGFTGRASGRWMAWISDWRWIERAQAWDDHQGKLASEKVFKDQVDARVRHARMANAALQSLTIPSRALLEVLQDQTVMQRLVAEAREHTRGVIRLIELVTWAAKAIPGLVDVERMALGMSRDVIEITEPKREDALGVRIRQDAAATDLAIALLDRLAGTENIA
jgi:hypothetical protein